MIPVVHRDDDSDFELRYPGRVSQIGFLAAWIGVAALVAFVYWQVSS